MDHAPTGAHSVCWLFVHLVWSPHRRSAVLTPDWETRADRAIRAKALQLRCEVLAYAASGDHVHVLVRYDATISIADLVQGLKGVSSHALNASGPFRWQRGYFAESVHRRDLDPLRDYIERQRTRHEHSQPSCWRIDEGLTNAEPPSSPARP
ncbi:MAG: IS200/IS605 family transposase [Deltaproteobacteria bacterium]|nr:IS200/IS605 family transposase [Deltaproteobacteria bacterium]